jgi:hypothetical protein
MRIIAALSMACVTFFSLSSIAFAGQNGNADERLEHNNEKNFHEHRKPPEAAFNVCAGKLESSTCQFQGRKGRTVNGFCIVPRVADDTRLVCRPDFKDHAPHQHDHSESAQAAHNSKSK